MRRRDYLTYLTHHCAGRRWGGRVAAHSAPHSTGGTSIATISVGRIKENQRCQQVANLPRRGRFIPALLGLSRVLLEHLEPARKHWRGKCPRRDSGSAPLHLN